MEKVKNNWPTLILKVVFENVCIFCDLVSDTLELTPLETANLSSFNKFFNRDGKRAMIDFQIFKNGYIVMVIMEFLTY